MAGQGRPPQLIVMWEKEPLRRARRQVAGRDDEPGLRGQAGEAEFPGQGAIGVGTACVRSDEKPGSLRVVGWPCYQRRIDATANVAVSWSVLTLTQLVVAATS